MRKLILALSLLSVGGCNSRILDHSKDKDESAPVQSVITGGMVGACPEIAMQTPIGFTVNHLYGVLRGTSEMTITDEPNSTIFVYLRDAMTWFKLGKTVSGAYWYERKTSGTVTFHGPYLQGKEVCVYEYLPSI